MMYYCRKRYSVCVPCILLRYNTKSVPLLVSSIHDFDMVHTGTDRYVLLYFVCISTYWYIPVCTDIYLYILNTLFLYNWSLFQMDWLAERRDRPPPDGSKEGVDSQLQHKGLEEGRREEVIVLRNRQGR